MSIELLFLKLGGSLITDKTGVELVRESVLKRLAEEIAIARLRKPGLQLVLGHGSGSFGHIHGARHGTRDGVQGEEAWRGFAAVSDAAARLNRHVVAACLSSEIPAVTVQPSALARCRNGVIEEMPVYSVAAALAVGLVPVVYGDVAFDSEQGGTIISTEEVLTSLSSRLQPNWLLLAGETPGVLDQRGEVVPKITTDTFSDVEPALKGSRGTDVTGGMASKVQSMLDLVATQPQLSIRIFSGLEKRRLVSLLLNPGAPVGTLITAGGEESAKAVNGVRM